MQTAHFERDVARWQLWHLVKESYTTLDRIKPFVEACQSKVLLQAGPDISYKVDGNARWALWRPDGLSRFSGLMLCFSSGKLKGGVWVCESDGSSVLVFREDISPFGVTAGGAHASDPGCSRSQKGFHSFLSTLIHWCPFKMANEMHPREQWGGGNRIPPAKCTAAIIGMCCGIYIHFMYTDHFMVKHKRWNFVLLFNYYTPACWCTVMISKNIKMSYICKSHYYYR